jgi:hypothetical protein
MRLLNLITSDDNSVVIFFQIIFNLLKTEGVSSKEFVVTCEQCWKTFYFSRDYAKHLPCYVRQSKLGHLDNQ